MTNSRAFSSIHPASTHHHLYVLRPHLWAIGVRFYLKMFRYSVVTLPYLYTHVEFYNFSCGINSLSQLLLTSSSLPINTNMVLTLSHINWRSPSLVLIQLIPPSGPSFGRIIKSIFSSTPTKLQFNSQHLYAKTYFFI